MQIKELKKEGLKREYQITVVAGAVREEMDKRLQEFSKKIKMPGFRAGKVPLALVKKKHGKELLGDVLESLVARTSRDLFQKEGIRPALQPKIEVTSFDEDKDLEYKAAFEIFPEVPSIDWKKLSVEVWKAEADEKSLTEGLERIRANNKTQAPLEKARGAAKGDTVVMDFEGSTDGVKFEGGTAKDFRIEIGSGGLIPGFEDQLIGAKKGQSLDVKVTFPKEYHATNLAGKAAVFAVTVNEILEPKDSALDDSLAKTLGFDDLNALKDAVKEQIQKDYDGLSNSKSRKELFDALDKQYRFAVPEGMVELEFNSLWEKVESAKRQNPDAYKGKKEEEQKKKMREMAERRVRLGIILAETARNEKIDVRDEDVQRAIYRQAMMYPGQERQVIEFYAKNPRALEDLKGPIIEDRSVEWALEQVKKTEKSVKPEQLSKYFEDEDEE
ncbi:MAG: tig [Rickettsiales bacterium]|nr:tig [Rickettsiales bacterium]